jgi:hypothetical protein
LGKYLISSKANNLTADKGMLAHPFFHSHKQKYNFFENMQLFLSIVNFLIFFSIVANVLALGAVADFGAQNCQYTTNVDAR